MLFFYEIYSRTHADRNFILSFSFSPTYALIYIIKILSQAVTLIAHFTPTCLIRMDHHQGVLLVLAKLLIKIIKL